MDFPLPQLGEGIYEAEMVRWLVKPGDAVRPGQGLLEVMTDKATMEVPSPFGGVIGKLSAEPGAKIKVGEPILTYEASGDIASPAQQESKISPTAVKSAVRNGATTTLSPPSTTRIAAAPSVRHFARKLGINLAEVIGSGPGGRILMEDIARIVQSVKPAERKKSRSLSIAMDLGTPGTTVKLVGMRRKISEHLSHSKRTIPHFSYMDECDVTELVRLRKALRDPMLERDIKLTFLPFIVKAVALALKQFPVVNSSLDDATETIRFHAGYHIGIAVAAPAGLIVPVVKDADRKDVLAIAREIDRLGEEARLGKSKLEDLKGGTFTVSSVGNIGGLVSTPIINHPEVGILGIGKIVKRPIYDDQNRLRPADIVYLSFSFDHRVVDGAVGAMFANKVIEALKEPALLLLPQTGG